VGRSHCRALPIVGAILVLAACTFPPLRTPTPTPSPSPSATAAPTVAPTSSPTPTPQPTTAAAPTFGAGQLVATAIDGLRVRQRPALSSIVVTGLLPLGAITGVVMGPISVQGMAWYLVADADAREPQFDEGWIAAGTEADPFLVATGERNDSLPYVASFAQTGDAAYGPVSIGADAAFEIRWVAVDPERLRCDFAVLLAEGDAEPIPAIRATIGNDVVPGTLQPTSFDALGVRGEVFVTVSSDCAWTLVIQSVPDETPMPSSTSGP
jgi:hypothetical protein